MQDTLQDLLEKSGEEEIPGITETSLKNVLWVNLGDNIKEIQGRTLKSS